MCVCVGGGGGRGGTVVKALRCKSEGRWFDPSFGCVPSKYWTTELKTVVGVRWKTKQIKRGAHALSLEKMLQGLN